MGKSKADHAVMINQGMQCLHCGDMHILPIPIEMSKAADLLNSFADRHARCKKNWVQPTIDIHYALPERIKWWLRVGEKGEAAIAIYNAMMPGYHIYGAFDRSTPDDADSFRRCYLLLKTIPEWRERLIIMNSISDTWEKFVKNWDRITHMFEMSIASVKGDATELNKLIKELNGQDEK